MGKQFYYKKNRLQQLRGFYYAAQFNSMSKAAKFMSLNQSAVTLQIQSLERDLDVKLFKRSGKSIQLTEDGEILYKLAIPHVQGIDGIHQRFTEEKKTLNVTTIHIAAHYIAILYLLPKYVAMYQKIYPDVQIKIHNIDEKEALKAMLNNEIDLMLYPTNNISPECNYNQSFSFDVILLMHKDHILAKKKEKDITLEEIANHSFINVDSRLIPTQLIRETIDTYGWSSNIELTNGNGEIIKHLLKENLGITLLSRICLREDDTTLVAKSMRKFFPDVDYCIMTKKGRNIIPAVRDFIEVLDSEYFKKVA